MEKVALLNIEDIFQHVEFMREDYMTIMLQ